MHPRDLLDQEQASENLLNPVLNSTWLNARRTTRKNRKDEF